MKNNMKKCKTKRGFNRINFKDTYGFKCSIERASNFEPTIWVGPIDNRMILDRKLSWKVAKQLFIFAIIGKF